MFPSLDFPLFRAFLRVNALQDQLFGLRVRDVSFRYGRRTHAAALLLDIFYLFATNLLFHTCGKAAPREYSRGAAAGTIRG
jgi:hypothetical protein